jgi:hypothetical protein
MPAQMKYALALKFLGGIAFLAAIITAGGMNRSVGIIPLFAIAMTLAALILRRNATPGLDLAAMMGQPKADDGPPGFFDGALNMFVQRLIGVGVLFVLTVLIAALFRETSIDRVMDGTDMLLVGVPFAITLASGFASQRMLASMGEDLSGMMAQMQERMAAMQASRGMGPGAAGGAGGMDPGRPANDDDVIDGEFEEVEPAPKQDDDERR